MRGGEGGGKNHNSGHFQVNLSSKTYFLENLVGKTARMLIFSSELQIFMTKVQNLVNRTLFMGIPLLSVKNDETT